MMRLLVIAPSLRDTSPGSRFRIEQWIPYLEAAGVSCTYAGFEDETLHELIYTPHNYAKKTRAMMRAIGRRISLVGQVRSYDLVFLFEEAARVGPAVLERVIRWLGVPVVYDFCDPIYLPYKSPMNHHLARLKCFGKTASICRLADHVLAGNEDLADYARRYNPRVTVVPITIDTAEYSVKSSTRPAGEPPVVGWSGSHSTIPHLQRLAPILKALAAIRRYRLEVIGTEGLEIDGVDVTARRWSRASEVEDLHGFDIGIMPLPDDPWTRLRSHLKVRQYMGVGLPSVVSPVGVNRDLVEDGVNGFLAETADDWLEKLVRLIDDSDLRREMGRRARARIEESYSGALWAGRVLEILRQVRGPEGSPSRPEEAWSREPV